MRKVVLGLGISLDGYIARPDGSVDFLFMPKDYSMGPFFATIDVSIMGRKTYDVALKMGGGSYNDSGLKSYVFSHSQPPGARGGVTFVNESPKIFVEKLRKSPGKSIWLMGGELVRDFLKLDLVDELYIGVVPVLIGEGLPLVPARLSAARVFLARKQDFLERHDCPQVRPRAPQTQEEITGRTALRLSLPPPRRPRGQRNHLSFSWTSNQFPPLEPSCRLELPQSKVRP